MNRSWGIISKQYGKKPTYFTLAPFLLILFVCALISVKSLPAHAGFLDDLNKVGSGIKDLGEGVGKLKDEVMGTEEEPAEETAPAQGEDQPAAPQTTQPAPAAPVYNADKQRVAKVQSLLNQLGYNVGPVDGVYGTNTRAAIQTFQLDRQLPPQGDVTDALIARLQHTAQTEGLTTAAGPTGTTGGTSGEIPTATTPETQGGEIWQGGSGEVTGASGGSGGASWSGVETPESGGASSTAAGEVWQGASGEVAGASGGSGEASWSGGGTSESGEASSTGGSEVAVWSGAGDGETGGSGGASWTADPSTPAAEAARAPIATAGDVLSREAAWFVGLRFEPAILTDDLLNKMSARQVEWDQQYYKRKSAGTQYVSQYEQKPVFTKAEVADRLVEFAAPELAPKLRQLIEKQAKTIPLRYTILRNLYATYAHDAGALRFSPVGGGHGTMLRPGDEEKPLYEPRLTYVHTDIQSVNDVAVRASGEPRLFFDRWIELPDRKIARADAESLLAQLGAQTTYQGTRATVQMKATITITDARRSERHGVGPTLFARVDSVAVQTLDGKPLWTVDPAALRPYEAPTAAAEPDAAPAFDVIGLRPGMSLAEADGIVREHMSVSYVFRSVHDPKSSKELRALMSSHAYVSKKGETIILYDGAPAAPDRVVGVLRRVTLPDETFTQEDMGKRLVEHYGEPRYTNGWTWQWGPKHKETYRFCYFEFSRNSSRRNYQQIEGGEGFSHPAWPDAKAFLRELVGLETARQSDKPPEVPECQPNLRAEFWWSRHQSADFLFVALFDPKLAGEYYIQARDKLDEIARQEQLETQQEVEITF